MILDVDVVLPIPSRRAVRARVGPGLTHLAGGNGAGKTTLLRVLCAELPPWSGRVALDGRDPAVDTATRARIAFLPAVPELPGFLSVREGWRLLAAVRDRGTWDGAGLERRFALDPHRRLDQLSVGQRRKAELIAALAGDPDVLLLDEVLAPLDPDSVAAVCEVLEERRSGRIILLTSHGALRIVPDAVLSI